MLNFSFLFIEKIIMNKILSIFFDIDKISIEYRWDFSYLSSGNQYIMIHLD